MPKYGNRPSTGTGSSIRKGAPSVSRTRKPDVETGSVIRKGSPDKSRLRGDNTTASDLKK